MAKVKKILRNRDISWLGFNERVLQEAEDARNPLIERFRFLGIFSNNLDEFYRVRVASVKRLSALGRDQVSSLREDPNILLQQFNNIGQKLQDRFESTFRRLVVEAEKQGIHIINEKQVNAAQRKQISEYFQKVVETNLVPIMIRSKNKFPQLLDKRIYLAVKLWKEEDKSSIKYALIEIPTSVISRFYVLEAKDGERYVILLDDIIRMHLRKLFHIFEYDHIRAYTFKFTRDAELDVEDDLNLSTLESLSKSIHGRKRARPTRFVHDRAMPADLRDLLLKSLKIKEQENIIAGGRYHNFKDFIDLASLNLGKLGFRKLPPLNHPDITGNNVLDCIRDKDILLNYPFQSFEPVIDMLRGAAIDPNVKSIKINLYRVAKRSKIINALISAAKNGKKVLAVVELRARFDEENNIKWSNILKEQGVEVIFGVSSLKVHSKLILISRKEGKQIQHYAHVGTGNFHEDTARVYTDMALLTADQRLASEVAKVFDFFKNNFRVKRYSHLIISPTGTRRKFLNLINNEIKNAKKGLPSGIFLKLNNLVDERMVNKLYDASRAGVKVRIIVRGSCSLVPQVEGLSENIEAISIVDRFLEHSRVLCFKNGGEELVYISSADWMTRNLDNRVEVSAPIYNTEIKNSILELLEIQWKDSAKARYVGLDNLNQYVQDGQDYYRSQIETYKYFKNHLKR